MLGPKFNRLDEAGGKNAAEGPDSCCQFDRGVVEKEKKLDATSSCATRFFTVLRKTVSGRRPKLCFWQAISWYNFELLICGSTFLLAFEKTSFKALQPAITDGEHCIDTVGFLFHKLPVLHCSSAGLIKERM